MGRRFVELDSLRGIAALSVVFHHYLVALPAVYMAILPVYDPSIHLRSTDLWPITFTPLHALWSGTEAVIFFFVLSGFVLSMPFQRGQDVQYDAFLIRRICRIYLPYLGAVLTAITASMVLSRHGIPGLSGWFNSIWIDRPNPELLIGHLTLIGSFRNGVFDPVLWSLVYEMRISIIFPLLVFFAVRYNSGWVVFGTIGLGLVAPFLGAEEPARTLEYVPMFVAGALLARHQGWLVSRYGRLPRGARPALLLAAVLCYSYPWWFFPHSSLIHPIMGLSHARLADEWATTIGAAIFIVVAIASGTASRVLHHPVLLLFGKMSYSVYLYHAIVFFSLVYLLYPALPVWAIWPVALTAMSGVAYVAYRCVELPAIRLGHGLAGRLLSKQESQRVFREAA